MLKRSRGSVFAGLVLLFISVVVWSVLIEPRWVAKRTIDVALPGHQLKGLKVAIASDWHLTKRPLSRVMTVERAQAIVDEINDSHPDVILLLGDYVADSNYVPTLAETPEDEIALVLSQLKAPKGVYAVLGNHDWWRRKSDRMSNALSRHGIHVLENEVIPLPGTDACIVGIGDDLRGRSHPEKAFKALPASAPALIFMHEPISFSEFPAHLNAISFAGHTHGGQINLPFYGALALTGRTPKNWAYGWVRYNENSMYVTSGLGVSILPVRFNMRPEWVMFTIQ